jgi:hypothetical protein
MNSLFHLSSLAFLAGVVVLLTGIYVLVYQLSNVLPPKLLGSG